MEVCKQKNKHDETLYELGSHTLVDPHFDVFLPKDAQNYDTYTLHRFQVHKLMHPCTKYKEDVKRQGHKFNKLYTYLRRETRQITQYPDYIKQVVLQVESTDRVQMLMNISGWSVLASLIRHNIIKKIEIPIPYLPSLA